MNNIDNTKHEELVGILEQLIETIGLMRNTTGDYLLCQNEEEAKEWLVFLKEHFDKEELKTLENEMADRFFYKYDVQISKDELDNIRANLIKKYLIKSNEYLK